LSRYLYNLAMRRRRDTLIPIESAILEAAQERSLKGSPTFHGFGIARQIQDNQGARRLTGYGTLYRALERLESRGLLRSWWEDPAAAARERRPMRRLYELTADGAAELVRLLHEVPAVRLPDLGGVPA
jgi:PadR family transcriptional regulator, regulatory protein PadR